MKRYLVFAGDWYYPGGGASDFLSDHDSQVRAERAALDYVENGLSVWAHVFDQETRQTLIQYEHGSAEKPVHITRFVVP